jgi:hypothetical protein
VAIPIIKRSVRAVCLVAALSCASVAQGAINIYTANLSGPNESPANSSPGTGTATVTIDTVLNTMSVSITFSGLTSGTTASHIHSATTTPFTGTAMVATQVPYFTGFPLGVTSGTYSNLFDLLSASSYNPAFVTAHGGTVAGAESALVSSIASGTAYLNIHTTNFPGGEIRGFLIAVPEAATWAMMLVGFAAIGLALRRHNTPLRAPGAAL